MIGAESLDEGRFGKRDLRSLAEGDILHLSCRRTARLPLRMEENGLRLPCQSRAIRHSCTSAKKRRITRREHEHVLEAVQRRLDEAAIELAPIRALARRDA
jgi:hypothetical protein